MEGNAARWMKRLEVQREAPAMFPNFECMFIDQYAPLDNNYIARDKL